ncbi:MAG TPA: Asp-tRNA(Asn)/Glu-tRNA(Gln) amidotransferase GatCAB subunit B [Lentisphaeria bacterium]|nr:MAG: aspartyl/glutamyl-tRNA amidotransferase subunit B [Lentisphaerae bacterium GWF2_49_21]HBC88212.1 Asp-tRNA(Asn)/Glu-tRNA(Gln) amidotransferase GatCAB subunit B [Lentisphaeria bacterium]
MAKYDVIIGLEVHVQVRTNTKMFCSCPNKFGQEPNSMVCPVCMGFPGVMPYPNREAIRRTVMAGLMCSCEIAKFSKFDRKSYFYPDMPKNYQISQYDLPLCGKGKVHVCGKGFSGQEISDKLIGITRIHLEEDVGKLNHFAGYSGIDFNRAGVPLMEIVSEPEMNTADEAYAYLTALKQIMQYADISDCDMEKGQMRCDVNISLKLAGVKEFGTKVEIKNLNSFRSAHRSIEHEIVRQAEVLDNGGKIFQETRGWTDERGETYILRSKESAHDYRYFPEPDLLPMTFTDADIAAIKKELPELPEQKRERFVATLGLTPYDAQVLTLDKTLSDYFDEGAKQAKSPKILANWIITELLRELNDRHIPFEKNPIPVSHLVELVELVSGGTITGKSAKEVFSEMFAGGKAPKQIVTEKGLVQISDDSEIEKFVVMAIEQNPLQVKQYKEGKTTVLQFFVGQVMKLSKGKANPQIVNRLLKEKLDKI